MTNREFLIAIANLETASADIREYAQSKIDKMDAANEARKNKPSKKAIENAPLVEKILTEILSTEVMTAAQVGEALGVSTSKASSLLRSIPEGTLVVTEVKVPGKATCKGYALAE